MWVVCYLGQKQIGRLFFFSLRPSYGGPGYFSRKLSREFGRTDIHVTYDQLRNAEAALLFSVSWGEWFYRLSKLWNVKTFFKS
ncbi:MAG: hypothetical protein CM1200mP6_10910 [Anaerolineaceae bacterium]|nr:MAG: hypothetical protein CM1200mP6_10910 [Anaerolineaceae bacterium]